MNLDNLYFFQPIRELRIYLRELKLVCELAVSLTQLQKGDLVQANLRNVMPSLISQNHGGMDALNLNLPPCSHISLP